MPDQKLPPQSQERQPGIEGEMSPRPKAGMEDWKASSKLAGKCALVTGGDSGIGRAVAIGFAKEGADIAIAYKDEHGDAEETRKMVEAAGRRCLLFPGDIGDPALCDRIVADTVAQFGRIDVLVNNAAEQHLQPDFAKIDTAQVERTFRTNILGMFWMTRAALPHIPAGGSIINSTSVTAYKGSPAQVDYAATKGAIVAFTRSLSQLLWEKKIRVNAVAPGPVWTPLIPASYPPDKVAKHGESVLMERPGEPDEMAPSYIFLAAESDSSYMTGQVLHPNGGTVVNG